MSWFNQLKPTQYYVVTYKTTYSDRLVFNGPWGSRKTAEEWCAEYDYDDVVTGEERARLLEAQRTKKLEKELGIK